MVVFKEITEKKIDDLRDRLARLIRYTDGEPKEMIKHYIQQPVSVGYKNARSLLQQKYGNPKYIVAAYQKEIKSSPQLKPADGAAYRRFYNFLLKCERATYGRNDLFGTIKVAGKFKREMEQNCSKYQKEIFERARFCRFNSFCR